MAQLIFANGVSKKLSSFSHLLSTLCFPHSLVCIGLLSAPHSSMAMRASLRLPLSSLPTFFTQPLLRVSNVSSVPSLPFRRETILHCHMDAGRATGEELTVERIVEEDEDDPVRRGETCLYSVSSLPLMALAALPGGGVVKSAFEPFIELVRSWNLPDWLVHWGHPVNMAVVLFAMGGYGTYLGFRIRYSEDVEEKAKAKDLHPKLLGGMFFFFALGATGGITSLLMYDKPILESPHAVLGLIGLLLLSIQTILPALFEGNPGLRNVHGVLGSGIMTLFLIHAALGLQLGLSF